MERYRKVRKGTNPICVGRGGTNDKYNEKEKSIGQNKGDTASKGVAVTHGPFRRSARNHSETTFFSKGDTSAYEVKKRDRYP